MIFLLHGFLGNTQDWVPLSSSMKELSREPLQFSSMNLFGPQSEGELESTLSEWAEKLITHLSTQNMQYDLCVGYSLGGRLALHLLEAQTQLKKDVFKGFVFLSTHYGLETLEEKEPRLKSDALWARDFDTLPWIPLLKKWSSQAVFKNSPFLLRKEKEFSRDKLSHALRYWSLGYQENFLSLLQRVPTPSLWCVGEHDEKFRTLSKPLENSLINVRLIPNSGHRLHLERPDFVAKEILQFYRSLSYNFERKNLTQINLRF